MTPRAWTEHGALLLGAVCMALFVAICVGTSARLLSPAFAESALVLVLGTFAAVLVLGPVIADDR